MNEKDQIHTLLTDLAGQDPPVDIDLDRQIQRGQTHVRRRTAATCLAALAIPAVIVGGIVTLRPNTNGSNAPAAGPGTPVVTVRLPDGTVTTMPSPNARLPFGKASSDSTQKSRALLTQFRSLAPELAETPGFRLFDMRDIGGPTDGAIHAGYDWIWEGEANQVTVGVVVGPRGKVPPVCDRTTGPEPCNEIRHLPDGSTAYLRSYLVPGGGHSYEVLLVHPDGTSVSVFSAAQKPKGAKHDAPLSLARVLEIAQKITVKPGN